MKEFIQRLLKLPRVFYVENSNQVHPRLEDNHYLQVSFDDLDLLFTVEQVRVARDRSQRNKEDIK